MIPTSSPTPSPALVLTDDDLTDADIERLREATFDELDAQERVAGRLTVSGHVCRGEVESGESHCTICAYPGGWHDWTRDPDPEYDEIDHIITWSPLMCLRAVMIADGHEFYDEGWQPNAAWRTWGWIVLRRPELLAKADERAREIVQVQEITDHSALNLVPGETTADEAAALGVTLLVLADRLREVEQD